MHPICPFAYARVSTFEQNPENQIKEIKEVGFIIEPHRIITETISGGALFNKHILKGSYQNPFHDFYMLKVRS